MTASFEPTTNDTGPPLPNPTPVVLVIRFSAICSRTTEAGPRPNSSHPPVSSSSSERAKGMTAGEGARADAVGVRDAGAAAGLPRWVTSAITRAAAAAGTSHNHRRGARRDGRPPRTSSGPAWNRSPSARCPASSRSTPTILAHTLNRRARRVLPGIGKSTTYGLAMRQLRFVGPGDDSEHVVVETVDGDEQFVLKIGDALRMAIRPEDSAVTVSTRVAPEPTSSIRPREIQMRVRGGEAPHTVASEAGISIDRVLLFAGPVLEERTRMAGEARRARARRSTPDGQLVNFGEAGDERFTTHGIDPMAVRWDSHRRDDGQWVVSAGWRGGESERVAEWAFSLSARAVTPLDETAADLLSDRPIRPVVSIVPDASASAEEQKAARARIPSWDDILLGVRRKRD